MPVDKTFRTHKAKKRRTVSNISTTVRMLPAPTTDCQVSHDDFTVPETKPTRQMQLLLILRDCSQDRPSLHEHPMDTVYRCFRIAY